MHDLIFLSSLDDYTWVRSKLLERFPKAKIEDETNFRYTHHFSFEHDISENHYMFALIDLGLTLHSLNFQIMLKERLEDVVSLVAQYQEQLSCALKVPQQ
jgi:hypothetical protein